MPYQATTPPWVAAWPMARVRTTLPRRPSEKKGVHEGNSEKVGHKQVARGGDDGMRSEKEQVWGTTTLPEMAAYQSQSLVIWELVLKASAPLQGSKPEEHPPLLKPQWNTAGGFCTKGQIRLRTWPLSGTPR